MSRVPAAPCHGTPVFFSAFGDKSERAQGYKRLGPAHFNSAPERPAYMPIPREELESDQ